MAGTITSRKPGKITTVLFDFMGTCLDWRSVVVESLPSELSEGERSIFALEWRQAYFDSNAARLEAGHQPEDFDTTVRNTLEEKVGKLPESKRTHFTNAVKTNAITAWHHQKAWDDVAPAIEKLRQCGLEIFVHANGTTRLQLDNVRSSGLRFDMLFSSELLQVYKPAPENYFRALKLIRRNPEECVTVAAHISDLRGAKAVGMRTVYIRRCTDDIKEDMEVIRREVDVFLKDMADLDAVITAFK